MNKRILFCMESNSRADTDYQYIHATIQYYYEDNKNIAYKKEHLNSKTRYNDRAIIKKIRDFQRYSRDAHIIYCIDTDDYLASPKDKALLEQIDNYCHANGYDLIFFCRDVEEVYWGKQVHDTEKTKMAIQFKKNNMIVSVNEENLRKEAYALKSSNILDVLDQYFVQKQQKAL